MHETVFYDGDCGLCHASVRFLIRHDRDGSRFRYAPLFGTTFDARVPADLAPTLADSLVVFTAAGTLLQRSAAVFHLLRRVGGPGRVVGTVGSWLPRRLTDWGYDRIASVRKRWFDAPRGSCPVVAQDLRARFDP